MIVAGLILMLLSAVILFVFIAAALGAVTLFICGFFLNKLENLDFSFKRKPKAPEVEVLSKPIAVRTVGPLSLMKGGKD